MARRRNYYSRSRNYTSNPGSSLSWIVIGLGGYIVLRFLGIDPLALISSMFGLTTQTAIPPGTTTNANNPGTSTNPSTTTNTTNTNNALPPNTKSLVLNAATQYGVGGAGALNSVDTWNYFYNQIRGIPGPAPEDLFPNNDKNQKYSIDEWWAAMTSKGFSGLGQVANLNPYTAGQNGPRAGAGYTPLGSEMYTKFLN
jgi:hypothetical protein